MDFTPPACQIPNVPARPPTGTGGRIRQFGRATNRSRLQSGPRRGRVKPTPRRPSGSASAAPVPRLSGNTPSEGPSGPGFTAGAKFNGRRRAAGGRTNSLREALMRRKLRLIHAAAVGGAVLQLLVALLAVAPAGDVASPGAADISFGCRAVATTRSRLQSGPRRGMLKPTPRRPSGCASAAPVPR